MTNDPSRALPRPLRVSRTVLYSLASEAARDPATVMAVLAGKGSPMSKAAVLAAAKRIGRPEMASIVTFLEGSGGEQT